MDYVNDPYSGNSADSIACTHLLSPWNNIVYDLQPGSVILPTTPEPSNFIGMFLYCAHSLNLSYVTQCVRSIYCVHCCDD